MESDTTRTHPLHAVVDGVRDSLDGVASCPAWSLPDEQLGGVLAELVTERARLDGLILDLVRQADVNAVCTTTGAASTAVWVRQQTRMSRKEAGGAVKLAKALDTTLKATKQALSEGQVSLRHAREIHLAMGKLPPDIDAEVKAKGEAALVEQAQVLDPVEIRALGDRLYQVVAPEDADNNRRACSLFRVRRGGQDWLRREVRGLERVFGVGAGEGIGWQFG